MTISLENKIHKYNAWRLREPVERPMVGLMWEPDIPPLPEMVEAVGVGNEVQPADIRPEMFLPHIESWHQQESRLASDVIQPYTPAFGMPWVEAIAGCRVMAQPGSLWAEPLAAGLDELPSFQFDPENPWLKKLIEFTQELVRFSAGRFPVALPQMRGPLDVLAALREPQRLCLDLHDDPESVYKLLGELTDLWIRVAEAILSVLPPFLGGYSTRMKMWAPGKAITPQNDISTLISAQMYKQYVLPWDRKIFEHFPYHSFHMHSTEHHHAPALAAEKALTAIEFTLEQDLGGPPLEAMLPVARRILEYKPLLLVPLDIETANVCIENLSPEGLCVMVGLNEPQIGIQYQAWLEKWCGEIAT